MVNSDLSGLETKDIFVSVYDEFPNVYNAMLRFNLEFRVAIINAKESPGGTNIIVGLFDSGKTHLNIRFAIFFFCYF